MCTQLDLQGEMLELCVPLDSVRAADSECATVQKALKQNCRWKRKGHYLNLLVIAGNELASVTSVMVEVISCSPPPTHTQMR